MEFDGEPHIVHIPSQSELERAARAEVLHCYGMEPSGVYQVTIAGRPGPTLVQVVGVRLLALAAVIELYDLQAGRSLHVNAAVGLLLVEPAPTAEDNP